jgi:hypothetical protein
MVEITSVAVDDGQTKPAQSAPGREHVSHVLGTSVNVNERVPFRLFQTPCCGIRTCWVMPKYPRYCPHCGHHFSDDLQSAVLIRDDDAWLKHRYGSIAHGNSEGAQGG